VRSTVKLNDIIEEKKISVTLRGTFYSRTILRVAIS